MAEEIRIIKNGPVRSFKEFLQEYRFQQIPIQEFRMKTENLRPLRRYREIKIYGFRHYSGISGMQTTYLLMVNTKSYETTLGAGCLDLLLQDIKRCSQTIKKTAGCQ